MIETVQPTDFIRRFCLSYAETFDHHMTGPERCHQPENQGSVSCEEGRILGGLAFYWGGPILEIGADLGISTRYMHEGLARRSRVKLTDKIVSLDYCHKWPEDPAWPFRVRIDQDTRLRLHPIVVKMAPYTFGFVDGDHTYEGVLNDIRVAQPLCNMLVFHDCSPLAPIPTNPSNGSEARRAVIETFGAGRIIDIPTACGLMVVTK